MSFGTTFSVKFFVHIKRSQSYNQRKSRTSRALLPWYFHLATPQATYISSQNRGEGKES